VEAITVRRDGDLRPCHRCAGALLLTLTVPATMTRRDGAPIAGHRTVPLCPRCDAGDRSALGVLAFFTVHRQIEDTTVGAAGEVLREWIDHHTGRR
jgi:hypothetical protein